MNLSHIDLSESDNLAAETTKLMMLFNLSNPSWTYDTLIFPALNVQIPDSFLGSNGFSISLKLPALRPSLECIIAPADSTINNPNSNYYSGVELIMGSRGSGVRSTQQTEFPWSLGTSNATIVDQSGSAPWANTYCIPNDTETSVPMTLIGLVSPVQWELDDGLAPYIYSTFGDQPEIMETDPTDIDPSAATFGFAAGFASGTKINDIMNISLDSRANFTLANRWDMETNLVVALCYQILEVVEMDVTFNWPNMTTSRINTPVPDESTARMIMSNESTLTAPSIAGNETPGDNPKSAFVIESCTCPRQ